MAQEKSNQPNPELKQDRKLSYTLFLEKILDDPYYVMQYAKMSEVSIEAAYIVIDARIRQLRSELQK